MKVRHHEPELMDARRLDEEELRQSLDQIMAVNRWLGGFRAVRRALRPWLRTPLHILDIGTGNASLPLHMLEWGASRGAAWTAVGVDWHPQIASLAQERAGARMGIVRADALRLPFGDRSFDIAMCTLTLHHFDDAAALDAVREMMRVSRRVILVNDLERSWMAWLGARLLAWTAWRGNALTRHDGPLSVRRSFTRPELHAIAGEVGLRDVRVRRHLPFQLLLEGRPAPPPSPPEGKELAGAPAAEAP